MRGRDEKHFEKRVKQYIKPLGRKQVDVENFKPGKLGVEDVKGYGQ